MLDAIRAKALSCERENDGEPAWNGAVHTPLFDLAFGMRQPCRTTAHNISKANISSPARIKDGKISTGKMVDYGVTLNDVVIPRKDVIRRLQQLGTQTLGINQTSHSPLLYRPLVLSIETKAFVSDSDAAHAQLALWTASQYKMLRKCRRPTKSPTPSPTLPVISTYKGEFVLHYAVDQGNEMVSYVNICLEK
jgi:hypothetical protein